ncbi:xanthine dehydrogenase small subunit [Zavarzinia aquatilis]|uniref:Xanthine dehydrogenase small subunit n=1 Tax=Zavarzinia aquatilis TaxID=2211142 RepID=A0A317E4Q3_9PROT|nr:xanthine dehydrogenase small subunit [Zavarzinia aquatilis]PWR21354.1 xanthine dehydrogenase small subunit [Zavarzinia aquatilis]
MTSRDCLRFILGTEEKCLTGIEPTTTVLDYLRLDEHRTGTKEGCAEGDCGACSVAVARPLPDGTLNWQAVNACIQPLGTLDGAQLVTVEDLAAPDGTLHPVQQAMVDAHGSQCGFCTPGFVMSLFAMAKQGVADMKDDQTIDEALAGNLCRCTGYAPIVRAAKALARTPFTDRFDDELAKTHAALSAMADGADVALTGPSGRRFFAPASADALAALLLEYPQAVIVAGATDVGLWLTKHLKQPETLIWLGRARDLATITESERDITIGAGVTYAEALDRLSWIWPDMGSVIRRIGSTQIRNAGTIGGNVANGSPIGDMPPMLIALGAKVRLRKGGARRELLLEDFFIAYGKQNRTAGEFVEAIIVPRPVPEQIFKAYKVSKRFDQDISAIMGAFSLHIQDGRVLSTRIAYGGMAGTPKRARTAEALLTGQLLEPRSIRNAMTGVAIDFQPLTDMRASSDYRMTVARNMLLRLAQEIGDATVSTRLWDKRGIDLDDL